MGKVNAREAKRLKLRKHMEDNNLNAPAVEEITLYKAQTVRAWMCGQREVPPRAMRLLKLDS